LLSTKRPIGLAANNITQTDNKIAITMMDKCVT